jgi:hypothetical protein
MKYEIKFDYDEESLFNHLKTNEKLFWNDDKIYLNPVTSLIIASNFENRNPETKKINIDNFNYEEFRNIKEDYSNYDSNISLFLIVGHNDSKIILKIWQKDFKKIKSENFKIIFDEAMKMNIELYKLLNLL